MKQTVKSLIVAFATMLFAVSAFAQVTTSALNGRVADKDGLSIPGAVVIATHTPSGTQYNSVANAEGRFFINGMRSGGPYTVEVSCLGYKTVTYTDVTLQLADAYNLNATLPDDNEMLTEAVVISTASSKFATEKTGAATNISSNQIAALPTVSRSLTEITKLSPYGGTGMSFAGADSRTANFTVDGANFNNNFGLSGSLPGGGSPIALDAIEEMQVVISPYDVRQSDFVGGGVNAITKSGTNTFKGTAYVYHKNENMRGNYVVDQEVAGARDKDRNTTYGFTLGGPIIKNKLFFFTSFEMRKNPSIISRWHGSDVVNPETGMGVADPDNYVSRTLNSDLEKLSKFLKDKYGYDTGSWSESRGDESTVKALARIDWNITDKHHLAVRYNYTLDKSWNPVNGLSSDCGVRTSNGRMSQYSMSYANSMYSSDKIANTLSVDLNSRLSDNLSNQLLATYSILDDKRGSPSEKFPFVDILDGTGDRSNLMPYISFGYELFTWYNGVHNRVFTLKDDVTYFSGSHKITAGASYEYQLADNSYIRNGTGYYRYNSLEDFYSGAAPETVNLTYGYDGNETPAATVRYHKINLYAQDEWNVSDRLKLTYGLRIQDIVFDEKDVMRNNAIYDVDYNGYHIDTGKWPAAIPQISPRVGFTWDVLGDKSLKLRGGTGIFTGRLPLVFFTNMPTNTNMVQNKGIITTDKNGKADPKLAEFAGGLITDTSKLLEKMHALDPEGFPLTITPDKGTLADGASIQAVDPKFKMPQVWKTSLAVDYSFPTSFPFSITGEFIYNKHFNSTVLRDLNLKDPEGFLKLNGADNRHIYTGANTTYSSHPAYFLTNTNKGYGYTAVVELKMAPVEGLNISAAYTHTASKELTSMPGSDASSAFTYIPTIEGPNNAPLHNSSNVQPERFYASLSYRDKSNNSFSFFYETYRVGGGTYMMVNDMNGDGYKYDVLYVPSEEQFDAIAANPTGNAYMRFKTADDFERFNEFVGRDAYLSSHKGQYTEAYSVFGPWAHKLDFHYSHDFKVRIAGSTNTLQLNFDVKNLLNLFNPAWGVSKTMNAALSGGRILNFVGASNDGIPVYTTPAGVNPDSPIWKYSYGIGQCWSAQIGFRYMFN